MTRFIVAFVSTLAVLAWAYVAGYASGRDSEKSKARDAEVVSLREVFEQGQAVGTVRDVVVTEYVDRDRVIYKTGKTITKEVPVYVTPAADASCTLTRGFVRLHDGAAVNVLPGPAEPADAEPAGVALSAATETITDNYTTCHGIRNQLIGLQDWQRKAKAALESKSHE